MERLQSALQDNKTLVQFKEPIRLPVDPHIQVTMATWILNYLIVIGDRHNSRRSHII